MHPDVAKAIDQESVAAEYQPPASGQYDEKGNWIADTSEKVKVKIAVQPVTGNSLKDLPEGLQPDVSCVGWSRTPVKLDGLIEVWGVKYRILFVWARPMDGFCKFAISEKLDKRE